MRLSSGMWTSVNTRSLFVGSIIALAVVAFAITGIGRVGRQTDGSTAARVGSQEIGIRELSERVQQQERQSGEKINEDARRANIQSALNELIQGKLFIEEANRIGWGASDLEVAQWIRSLPVFQDKDTKQFRPELYQRFLKSGQMTELDLFRAGRDAIAQNKMQALLSLPAHTPSALIKESVLRDETEFGLDFLEIKPSEQALQVAQAAEAKKYAADPASQKQLEQLYNESKAEFEHKAQIRVRSVLISYKDAQRASGDALKRDKAEAAKEAQELHDKVSKGENFAKLASAKNDDQKALQAGGDLGWLDETNIDPETLKAAQSLSKTNRLSGVVETPFGFRILEWTDARPESKKTFAEVKEELALRAVGGQVRQKMTAAIEKEAAEIVEKGDAQKLAQLIAREKLEWKKTERPVTASQRFIDGVGSSSALLPELFSLKKPGDLVHKLLPVDGRSFVFRLNSRKEPPAPQAEKIAERARQEDYVAAQTFASKEQRKLFEVYNREKEIQTNPDLLR